MAVKDSADASDSGPSGKQEYAGKPNFRADSILYRDEDDDDGLDITPTPRLHQEFDVIEDIGRGAFGKVMKALKKLDGVFYAIKEVKIDLANRDSMRNLLREVTSLSRLEHDNIVRYFSSWVEDVSGERFVYIQMELCGNQTLQAAIDGGLRNDMLRVWRIFREIMEGLVHIHAHGVIHGDVHTRNVFMDAQDHVKIGDFGFSTTVSRSTEGLSAVEKAAMYDIYGAGLMLLRMCFPPDAIDTAQTRNLMGRPPLDPDSVDPSLERQAILVNWMVNYDSVTRPTSRQVLNLVVGEVDSSPIVPSSGSYISYTFWVSAGGNSSTPMSRATLRAVHRILNSADNTCQISDVDAVDAYEDELLDQLAAGAGHVRETALSSGALFWLGKVRQAWDRIGRHLRTLPEAESSVRRIDDFLRGRSSGSLETTRPSL